MHKLIRYKVYWFIILMTYLPACESGAIELAATTNPNQMPAVTKIESATAIATIASLPIETVVPTLSATPSVIETTATTFVTNTPTPLTETLINQCPKTIDTSENKLWAEGSILFSTGQLTDGHADAFKPQEPGIWMISANQMEPKLAYEIPDSSSSWALLSNDGNTLLYVDNGNPYLGEALPQPKVTLYDLESQTEIWSINIPARALNYEWSVDGLIRFLIHEERLWEIGIRRTYFLIDPKTGQSQNQMQELSLPGFQFNNETRPHGYASISPSGEFALYSSTAESGVDIRLLNIMTGETLWKQNAQALPGPLQPEWAKDSGSVLFYFHDLIGEDSYVKILRLDTNGQLEELPSQPYPQLYPSTFIDLLTASPDKRYIIYKAGWQDPKGYAVDTATGQIREICEAGTTFVDGQWFTENLFVYRVLMEKDGELAHSLRVLDVSSWNNQIIFEAEPGYGINIFGWTPIEFVQS